jgi:flagellar assembly factor FliW
VVPNYAPDIADADTEFLGIQSPADAILLNIATIRNGEATINLKGPIVINKNTLVGKQCIPTNVAEFALQQAVSQVPVAA